MRYGIRKNPRVMMSPSIGLAPVQNYPPFKMRDCDASNAFDVFKKDCYGHLSELRPGQRRNYIQFILTDTNLLRTAIRGRGAEARMVAQQEIDPGFEDYLTDWKPNPLFLARHAVAGQILCWADSRCEIGEKPVLKVQTAFARPGYGPLLYDLALDWINCCGRQPMVRGGKGQKRYAGLMSDRGSVSVFAGYMWSKYGDRADISRLALPVGDDCTYNKGKCESDYFLNYAIAKAPGAYNFPSAEAAMLNFEKTIALIQEYTGTTVRWRTIANGLARMGGEIFSEVYDRVPDEGQYIECEDFETLRSRRATLATEVERIANEYAEDDRKQRRKKPDPFFWGQ